MISTPEVAATFIGIWAGLAFAMYLLFRHLQKGEREARVPEEEGKTPEQEEIITVKFDNGIWSRNNMGRIAFYRDFIAVCARARRVAIPYEDIQTIELTQDKRGTVLRIALAGQDDEPGRRILIRSKATESLKQTLDSFARQGEVA